MIRLIHFAVLLLTLLSYLPPWVDPDLSWPIATLGLLSPTLWFITLFFATYWLLKKNRRAWWSGLTLLLGFSMINNAFALPDGGPSVVAEDLKIVSLNGHGFRPHRKAQVNRDAIIGYLDSLNADVVCLQEFNIDPIGKSMTKQIKERTHLKHSFRDPAGCLAVFSRFPLENGETTYFTNRANGYLQVDVNTPQGTIHLCNVHLQTNAISMMAQTVAKSPDLREESTRRTIKTMFVRYGKSNKTRTEQSRQILEELSAVKHPVIVSGDFNDVPSSYLYRLFREDFQDAHLAQFWGLGTTYRGLIPGLRIDYLLPDYALQVLAFKKHSCWFSDHDAVEAIIRR